MPQTLPQQTVKAPEPTRGDLWPSYLWAAHIAHPDLDLSVFCDGQPEGLAALASLGPPR